MSDRIGCKIHNNLPWHSLRDVTEFFGKSDATISEHTRATPANDVVDLICRNTEGTRIVERKIRHFSFNCVAALCCRIGNFSHTERYRAFLTEMGIVWPDRVFVPCDEKNFSAYLSEIFAGVLHIDFEHQLGQYRVDGYIESLKLVFELDGNYHRKTKTRQEDMKRDAYLRSNFGVEIVRAAVGEYTVVANEIIKRLLRPCSPNSSGNTDD